MKKTLSVLMVIGLLLGGIPAPGVATPFENGNSNITIKDNITVNRPSSQGGDEKIEKDNKQLIKEQPIVQESSPLPPLPGEMLAEPKSTGAIGIDENQKSLALDSQVDIPILISEVENLDSLFYGGAANYQEVKANVIAATKERQAIAAKGGRQWDKESWAEPGEETDDSTNTIHTEEELEQAKQDRMQYEGSSDRGSIPNVDNANKDDAQDETGDSMGKEPASTGITDSSSPASTSSENEQPATNTGEELQTQAVLPPDEPEQKDDLLNKKNNNQETDDNKQNDDPSIESTEEPPSSDPASNHSIQQKSDEPSTNNDEVKAQEKQDNQTPAPKINEDTVKDSNESKENEIDQTQASTSSETDTTTEQETLLEENDTDTGNSEESEMTMQTMSGVSSWYDYNNLIGPTAYNNLNQQQYSIFKDSDEIISPKTGDLILKATDLNLPGRNGLDLKISRIFESNKALTGDRLADGNNNPFTDYTTYYMERHAIGSGWSWGFPYVEVRGDGSNKQLYYHDGQGATYRVNFSGNTHGTNLENYELGDIVFQQDAGTFTNSQGYTSKYVLIQADKTRQYFDQEGNLLGVTDRFGNKIDFKYTHIPTSIRTPNYHFKYPENLDVWTKKDINGQTCFSYDNTYGLYDPPSFKFTAPYGCPYAESNSILVPVHPNSSYYLKGFISNQVGSGRSGLAYRVFDENGNFLYSQVKWAPRQNVNFWYPAALEIYTSTNDRYIQLCFVQESEGGYISGQSYLDNVRFSYMPNVISKITDTIGRQVDFQYTGIGADLVDISASPGNITLNVKDPSASKNYSITYNRSRYDFADSRGPISSQWIDWRMSYQLASVSNGDRTTTYTYSPYAQAFSYCNWNGSLGMNGFAMQMRLTEVQYNNTKVKYTYSKTAKHLGTDGYYQIERITERSEQPNGTANTDYHRNYTYGGLYNGAVYNNETGYNATVKETDKSKDPAYEFTMNMQQDNGLQISQVNKGGVDYSTTKTNTSSGETEKTSCEQYDTAYPRLPAKVKYEQTNSQGSTTLYKGNTYTSWGGLASETRLLTNEQWNNSTVKTQNTITYAYDPTYKFLTSKTYYQSPSRQLTESISYDSQGRMVLTTNAKGETTSYEYGDSTHPGNLTRVVTNLPGGRTSITEYAYSDSAYAFPTGTTQKYTQNGTQITSTTTQTYEYLWGNIVNQTDPLGKATVYEYDNQGRVTKITYPQSTGKNGSYTLEDRYIYTYPTLNGVGVFKIENDKYKNGALVYATADFYDSHGNLIDSAVWDFERNAWTETKNQFNTYGQLAVTTDANNNQTSYSFDAWNRLNHLQDAQGNKQQYQYDIVNRTRISYFMPSGGARENDYSETYDQWGRVILRKGWPGGLANTPITEQYEYDLVGNCTKVIDPRNNQTDFQYDALNRVTKVTNALGEQNDYGYDRLGGLSTLQQYDGSTTFTTTKGYDERGLQISKQEPLGNSYTYQYNQRGQLSQANDPKGRTAANQYYDDGRLSQTTVANSSLTLYYTPLGGTERYYLTGDGESLDYDFYSTGLVKNKKVADFTTNFTYDLAGNLTQMTDPFSLLTSYQYDNLNRPQTITVGGKTFTYEYYGDGMIKAVNYPDASIRTEYTYDNINRLTTLINKKGSEIVSSFSYEYDKNGNIISVNENGSASQYEYDALNRLSSITRPDGSELHYSYDSRGNRTSVEVDISNVIPGTFAYNDWEELESFTTNDNTYTYTYDAQGLRTKKTGPDGTTRYHCDNAGRVIAESDASNQVTAEIIWGHKPLARKVGSSYYYYLYNGHGDVVALTDETGQIVNSYSYDEWGNILNKQETISNPIRYGGEYFDEESGLYYLRARYYDPTIGRFISKDSVEGNINNPLSLNLYTYCANNPFKYCDPSGHEWVVDDNQYKYLWNMVNYDEDEGNRIWAQDQLDRGLYKKWKAESVSQSGLDFIKSWEKCSLTKYDATGNLHRKDWTIGWGHKMAPGDPETITQKQADSMFAADMNKALNTTFLPFVKENNIILTQNQFDAMASFTFNMGQNSWSSNDEQAYVTMRNFIKNGDYSDAAARQAFSAYMGSNQLPGVYERRLEELTMFIYGSYHMHR